MLINSKTMQGLRTGFRATFNQAFQGVESQWSQVAMSVPSTTSENAYPWLGQFPRMREWLGDRHINKLAQHGFTLKNKTFEMTVEVPRESIEDDQFGIYSPMVAEMGQAAAQHPDEMVFSLLKDGFSREAYDGQPFFDTDHPVLDENGQPISVSNFGGGSGVAWFLIDNTRQLRPLIFQRRRDYQFTAKDGLEDDNVFHSGSFLYGVDGRVNAGLGLWQLAYGSQEDLTPDNYASARQAMLGLKGDYGRPLGVRPSLLVVPPELESKALEVLEAERNANGATNIYRNTASLLVSPWLA